jgi:hypothetical protein
MCIVPGVSSNLISYFQKKEKRLPRSQASLRSFTDIRSRLTGNTLFLKIRTHSDKDLTNYLWSQIYSQCQNPMELRGTALGFTCNHQRISATFSSIILHITLSHTNITVEQDCSYGSKRQWAARKYANCITRASQIVLSRNICTRQETRIPMQGAPL